MSTTGNKHWETMANTNIRVETVTHEEHRAEPYSEIVAAVKQQLEKNNAEMLKIMENQNTSNIEQAVKRALENQIAEGIASKNPKKEPEFRFKWNQRRYEAMEEINGKVEAAIKAVEQAARPFSHNPYTDSLSISCQAGKSFLALQGWQAVCFIFVNAISIPFE